MKFKKEGLTSATQKPAGSDWFLTPIMGLGFFTALILSSLAHRWGWPSLPLVLESLGLIAANIGLAVMNAAMLQNPFASKLLDINKDQYLVDTGLYAWVRHPLYAGGIMIFIAIPVALGCMWAMIPAIVAVMTLVVRIEFEEDMLQKGMDGYDQYRERVRYKLMPWVY
jgi:protein-S-isoprenylcysteine O-methyltransferase Ste14